MNIYLDIDGVLLANEENASNHVHEFLKLVHERFPDSTYWLTTHCRGNAKNAVERLRTVLRPETLELLQTIKPTMWRVAKTEAIDFTQPFIWFDDDLFDDEREDLVKHNALDNWVEVNLSKDPDQLLRFISSFPIPVAQN